MKLLNAIAAASAAEASFLGAALGLASVMGERNPWLDVLAQLAPVWLALAIVGGLLALVSIEAGVGKAVVLALAAAGLIANGALVGPDLIQATRLALSHPAPVAQPLTVVTFNAWTDNLDPVGSVQGLIASGADVIALQETGGLNDEARKALRAAYPYWTSCRPRGCDLLLLSKRPWLDGGSVEAPDSEGGFIFAWGQTLAPDGRPFTLATTHYRWPFPPWPQSAQRAALVKAVADLDRPDLIVTGDFNLTPWSAALRRQDRSLAPLSRRTPSSPGRPT